MALIQKAVRKKITAPGSEQQKLALEKCAEADNLLKNSGNNTEVILQAIDLFCEAVILNPTLTEPYIAIAYLCNITGDSENAVKLINKACKLEPLNIYLDKMRKELTDKYKNSLITETVSEISGKKLKHSGIRVMSIKNISSNKNTEQFLELAREMNQASKKLAGKPLMR